MTLYTVAEEAYFAHADTVSTNGIGAAVDAVLDTLRAQVEALEDAGCRRVVGGCNCRRSQTVRDVLALLDGESQ